MHRGHQSERMLDSVVSEDRSEVSSSVQRCKIRTLDMSQGKCSAELNTEARERGKARVETWISPPSVPSSCWPRYTLWVFVLRLLHTLPVWPAEGCFKVSLSHVLALELSLCLFLSLPVSHFTCLFIRIHLSTRLRHIIHFNFKKQKQMTC